MKMLMLSRSQVLTFSRFRALATLLLATAGLPTRGDTNFTSTGWFLAAPLPGITVTNSSGQVYLKGNVHVVRMESDNGLIAGRLQAWMDLAYQADGTALFSGPAYAEVGTWDAGTNFIPAGGVWALNYSGVASVDGSSQYSMTGHGIGGNIEGLRVSGTAERAAPGGPTDPYLISGTIKPVPVNTREVMDDFENNHFDANIWRASGSGVGTLSLHETNQQLSMVGTWRTPTDNVATHTAWVWADRNWSVPDGQTVELRADLAGLKPASAAAVLGLYHGSGQGYGLTKAADWILLWKEMGATLVVLSGSRVSTSNTNVVLVFALTAAGQNLVLTAKVLDQSGAVLAPLSYVDTPATDASLSQTALAQLIGWRICHDVGPEVAGAPWNTGSAVFLGVCQNTDGQQLPAEATYDNVELRTWEVPQVGYQRAIRLFWPDTGMNVSLERAFSLEGPWMPVQSSEIPGMRYFTVPMSAPQELFRVQPAP